MTGKRLAFFAGLVPLIVIILDQISKVKVVQFFMERYQGVTPDICADPNFGGIKYEFSSIFDWTLACNRGVSFGMMGGDSEIKRWLLTGFAVLVSCFLVWMIKTSKDRLTALSLGFVIGGSLGNVIDRVRFGAVVDFFDFNDIKFPGIFNVADAFITMGVIGILLASFFIKEEKDAPKPET